MPKPIPSPTVAASVPPDLQRTYFDPCAQFPFTPRAVGLNLVNAWWMAEASFAAYDTFDATGRGRIELSPLIDAGYSISPRTNGATQLLAIENADALIVAFRGTRLDGFTVPFMGGKGVAANWADVVTDASFLPAMLDGDAFVHHGFLQAFRAIESDLDGIVSPALDAGRAVWFCGHSLGAALATIAAHQYRGRVLGLYTFGSPRVGNGHFVDALSAAVPNIFRFVHHRDIVTTVPPEGLPVAGNLERWLGILRGLHDTHSSGYVHAGRVEYITGQGAWKIFDGQTADNGFAALAADAIAHAKAVAEVFTRGISVTDQGTWPIVYDAVADHAPVYYANKIFNACEEAQNQ
jgi:pimeloyl-ACP methyl ester carboxylesterase